MRWRKHAAKVRYRTTARQILIPAVIRLSQPVGKSLNRYLRKMNYNLYNNMITLVHESFRPDSFIELLATQCLP